MAKAPKLGNVVLLPCNGVGEQPVTRYSLTGICRSCEKLIELRKDGTLRPHGRFELKYRGL